VLPGADDPSHLLALLRCAVVGGADVWSSWCWPG
jgi:hypothetical protein